MSDAVDFPKKARSIISEQFGNRCVDMERTIRANLLLDGALSVIGKQKESKFLVLKGGSALQRAYRSPRFSDDLDFCLAKKNEKLSRESFIEFG
ncbi:MAG: nucleotidyl transferase AbiEii/AbiGii toxin family protein, partial [Synergistaceae bacterium]|nr:nucleotidyl transferase AbiEii/AbiGii toxin family protein [Synergistaceae bacterium]